MGYFDGNTVTALWNYAQNFAMSDNSWSDTFGPSTPGALHMFSGQTNGVTFPLLPAVIPAGLPNAGQPVPTDPQGLGNLLAPLGAAVYDGQMGLSLIGDIDPAGDVCSKATIATKMTAQNIGDLLNKADIPWGSFVGGFNLQTINKTAVTGCSRSISRLLPAKATATTLRITSGSSTLPRPSI